MPVNTKAIGKIYEPTLYAVGREKIKEYARAVGETNPLHLDVEAARAAGNPAAAEPALDFARTQSLRDARTMPSTTAAISSRTSSRISCSA